LIVNLAKMSYALYTLNVVRNPRGTTNGQRNMKVFIGGGRRDGRDGRVAKKS